MIFIPSGKMPLSKWHLSGDGLNLGIASSWETRSGEGCDRATCRVRGGVLAAREGPAGSPCHVVTSSSFLPQARARAGRAGTSRHALAPARAPSRSQPRPPAPGPGRGGGVSRRTPIPRGPALQRAMLVFAGFAKAAVPWGPLHCPRSPGAPQGTGTRAVLCSPRPGQKLHEAGAALIRILHPPSPSARLTPSRCSVTVG